MEWNCRMKELRILDVEGTPPLLVRFCRFLRILEQEAPTYRKGNWVIHKGASGHGEIVCGIEDRLESKASVVIEPAILAEKLLADEEYFDDVSIRVAGSNVEFGTHDGLFHFVRGEEGLLEAIAAKFQKTEIV